MPGNEVTVQNNALHKLEYNQLSGHITQQPEGKWDMQQEPDNKGRPRSLDENTIYTTYQWIWLTAGRWKEVHGDSMKVTFLRNPLPGKLR